MITEKSSYTGNSYKKINSQLYFEKRLLRYPITFNFVFDLNSIINHYIRSSPNVVASIEKYISKFISTTKSSGIYMVICEKFNVSKYKKGLYLERIRKYDPSNPYSIEPSMFAKVTSAIVEYLVSSGIKYMYVDYETDIICSQLPSNVVMVSEDLDVLLFGASSITRIPFEQLESGITVRTLSMTSLLSQLQLTTYSEFVNFAILVGTDYNKGIKGYGIQKGLANATQKLPSELQVIKSYITKKRLF